MKDFATVLLASLFVAFVLISLFSVERRTQGYELASSYGKIADSADELLETILLYQRKSDDLTPTKTMNSESQLENRILFRHLNRHTSCGRACNLCCVE